MGKTFVYTTALDKIRNMKARKKVIQGGTSAGKTYSILPILIDTAIKEPLTDISVVACTIPHLKGGAMKDFLAIMKMTNRFIQDHWHETDRKYTFANGSTIEFVNADGDKAIGPRRNILFLNEANLIPYHVYDAMAIRTDGDIYIDFNPTNKFWAHTEVLTEEDAELLIITYLDNEGLSDTTIKDLEAKRDKATTSKYNENWWRVYGLGQIGVLEGVVFDNWDEIDAIPSEAEYIATGLDWGYSNDVSAAVNVYNWNGHIILDEVFHSIKLSNKAISQLLFDNGCDDIIADSAEPKSIDELKSYGHFIRPAVKGADSINYGISLMQDHKILITKRSKNIKDEFSNYAWETNKDGSSTNKPIDKYNHQIDAIRYVFLMKLTNNDSLPLALAF